MTIDANLVFLPPPPPELEQVPPEPVPEDIPIFKVVESGLKPKPPGSWKVEKLSKGKACRYWQRKVRLTKRFIPCRKM